jgi:polysaccharide pyruvyl transferase WcaK-like protein
VKIYKKKSQKYKIYLSGGWGYGNRGDNAILMATLNSFREQLPSAEVQITSYSPEELAESQGLTSDSSLHRLLSQGSLLRQLYYRVRYRLWVRSGKRFPLPAHLQGQFDKIKQADIVVLAGGGYFNDNWTSMERAQYATIRMAHRAGTPVVIYGQTLGPFSAQTIEGRLKEHLKLVSKVVCRDAQSVSNARKAGVPESKLELSADEASLLPVAVSEMEGVDDGVPIVGLMVQYFRPHEHEGGRSPAGTVTAESYFPTLVSALSKFASQRAVRFRMIPSTVWDEVPMSKLATLMDEEGLDFDIVKNPSASEYVEACQNTYFMISTNMHPVIIAATNNRPSISLSYNFKLDYYMGAIGLDRFINRIDDFSESELFDQFIDIFDNCGQYSEIVAKNRIDVVRMARKNIEAVRSLMR